MDELTKEDVLTLDFIVNTLYERPNDMISLDSLINEGKISTTDNNGYSCLVNSIENNRFDKLCFILKENKAAKIAVSKDGKFILKNEKTIFIKESGGFEKIYNKHIKQSEKEEIEFENSKIDLRLKKWQLKTFWWIFGIAIIGFGLSIYNFTNSLTPNNKSKKQIERIEILESELRILQNFYTNQYTKDSLEKTQSKKEKTIKNIN